MKTSLRTGGWTAVLGAIVISGVCSLLPTAIAKGPSGGSTRLPSCLTPMTNRLPRYAQYLTDHANVLRAMKPCKIHPEVLQWFFVKLEEATRTGQPPTGPYPEEYYTMDRDLDSSISAGAQSTEIQGARLAQVFYANDRVNWKLESMSDDILTGIFALCLPGFVCNTSYAASGGYWAQHILDSDPAEIWFFSEQTLDMTALTSPTEVIAAMIDELRPYVHGGVYFDNAGNVVRRDDQGIRTVPQMAEEKISRQGCWSATGFLLAWARNLNIPGDLVVNGFGPGHATAAFKFTDQVLAHGDDPYNALMDGAAATTVLDSYARWASEVLKYRTFGPDAWFRAQSHFHYVARAYPSHYLMDNYCHPPAGYATGRAYLEDEFTTAYGSYATPAELDDLERRIGVSSQGCTSVPPDNP